MKKPAQSKKPKDALKDVVPKNKLVRFWKSLSTFQKILIDFAIFIVVATIIYFSYAWYQGYMLRKVDKKLDILTQEIISELGEPISQTKDQSCGHASAKFSKGRLGCGSRNTLVYPVVDQASTTRAINISQSIAKHTKYFSVKSSGVDNFNNTSSQAVAWTSYNEQSGPSRCSVNYYYYGDKQLAESSMSLKDSSANKYLFIYLGCYVDPLRPIFPVRD